MAQKFEYFGKYILLEKLATGGMAEVWLARAPGASGIGKFVAIKKILPQYSDNPEFIQMFKDEAAIAINLSHANIVSIYEFGMETSQLFLVMDYVEGRNLRQILNKFKQSSSRFSNDQIIYMMKEVAAGLDHAHRSLNAATGKPLNITHRDMSPQNIMVTFEGEVRIVDFGIAKAESQAENTKTGTLKGKFGYMSPEQAEGQVTDLRTDVFSLGIVLWELLANDRLFIANNEINTLKKIRECNVPSLTKINPNIHPELERITMKALTRDRNLRYQTAAAMHRDLNRFLNRQYPDFSPHDFSVFIKTQYTEEILENRKRLVEYAKIPLKSSSSSSQRQEMDRTLVTSFPQSTQVETARTSTSVNTGGTNVTQPTVTETETYGDNVPTQAIKTQNVSDKTGAQPMGMSNNTSQSNVLDFSKLQNLNEQRIVVEAKPPPSLDEADTGRSDVLTVEQQDTRSIQTQSRSSSRKTGSRKKTKKANSSLGIMLTVVVAVVTYIAGSTYFPKETEQIEQKVRELLSIRECTPGVDCPGNQVIPPRAQPNPPGKDIIPMPLPDPVVRPTPAPVGSWERFQNIVINSNPSGAEIFINGARTGAYTPERIRVPMDEAFTITLKKESYIEYKKDNLTTAITGSTFTADLQKAFVAYVNIDVLPPRNVRLFVNNVELRDNLPVTRYAIPAGVPISIRAENTLTGDISERTITLRPDQSSTVTLKLKDRSPANSKGSQ